MDDYTEPKDAKKFQWGDLQSPLSTNRYSDDEDDDDNDRYCQPYHPVPGPGGPMWRKPTNPPAPQLDDIYEISPGPIQKNSHPDYDVPPSAVDDYSRLRHNGIPQTKAVTARTVSNDSNHSDSDDSYNHTSTWTAQKTHRQNSNGVNPPATPSKTVPLTPTTTKNANRQNSNDSVSGTSPVFRNAPATRSPSQEGVKPFSRQKVIYPRQSGSSSSGVMANSEGGSHQNSGPALYEEAWDTARQQKKLEENLRLARSISACSDHFEDALEHLPEDWAPARPRSGARKVDIEIRAGGGKTIDPVTGGDYEPAWDLNRGLEEKLRSLQVNRAASDSGSGGGGDSNYQEPWDLAQKQRELEERIQKAKGGGGRGSGRCPQHHSHQQHAGPGQQKGGAELYEAPWDIKKGLAHMLQSSQSHEGPGGSPGSSGSLGSTRSNQSVTGAIGEPINAMIPLHNQEWYHGNISRDDAERMLRVCKDGSYLVRDSSDRCHYTLSIKSAIQTIHIQIDQCQKADESLRYILGKNSKAFCTIPSMIDYYTHHVVPIKGADHMTLLYPVHCKYSGGEESLA